MTQQKTQENGNNLLVGHVFSLVKSMKYSVPYRARKWMVTAQQHVKGHEKNYKCAAESLSKAALICLKSGEEYKDCGVILLDSSHKIKSTMHMYPKYYKEPKYRQVKPRKKHLMWC